MPSRSGLEHVNTRNPALSSHITSLVSGFRPWLHNWRAIPTGSRIIQSWLSKSLLWAWVKSMCEPMYMYDDVMLEMISDIQRKDLVSHLWQYILALEEYVIRLRCQINDMTEEQP